MKVTWLNSLVLNPEELVIKIRFTDPFSQYETGPDIYSLVPDIAALVITYRCSENVGTMLCDK